jgi:hypothetical protein
MAVRLALAGDTMLGRAVAERLAADPGHALLSADLRAIVRESDLFLLNLECCICDRGERVREPGHGFFFRSPPVAAERLAELGVTCVTLANNHAMDFGPKHSPTQLPTCNRPASPWSEPARTKPQHTLPRW